MCQEPAASNYWQDLLTNVANDLDLMLDDLCQDLELAGRSAQHGETSEFGDSMPRTKPLHEQSVQGLGNGIRRDAGYDSDTSGDYPSGSQSAVGWGDSNNELDSTQHDGTSSEDALSIDAELPSSQDLSCERMGTNGSGQQSSVGTLTSAVSDSSSSSNFIAEIGILERLICTHSIWYLPEILRGGTIHLLQGKEVGNFIIRKSSKPETLALTVRLPVNAGPHIEHYLIEKADSGEVHLEGSEILFSSVPLLVAHYCQCCDELPVQLALPSVLFQAASRQELLSLSLLGQDFWSSPAMFPPLDHQSTSNALPKRSTTLNTIKPPLPTPNSSPIEESSPKNTLEVQSNVPTKPSPPAVPQVPVTKPPGPPPPIPTAPKPPLRPAPPIPTLIKSPDDSAMQLEPKAAPQVPSVIDSIMHNKINGSHSIGKLKSELMDGAADSPGLYYHSSLADKVSDYEDIWGTSSTMSDKENQRTFVTFKPNVRPLSSILERISDPLDIPLGPKNVYIQAQLDPKEMVSNWTQTEESGSSSLSKLDDFLKSRSELKCSKQSSLSVQDIRIHNAQFSESRAQISSPFYAEPIDSVSTKFHFNGSPNQDNKSGLSKRLVCHRHSDPSITGYSPTGIKKSDPKSDRTVTDSRFSSMENISPVKDCSTPDPLTRKPPIGRKCSGTNRRLEDDSDFNAICKRSTGGVSRREMTWEVDSSWEWMSKDEHGSIIDDSPLCSLDMKFPINFKKMHRDGSQVSDTTTVEDLITLQSPDLCFSEESPSSSVIGASEYDNLEVGSSSSRFRYPLGSDHIDDTATEFSEPWDSRRWERVLQLVPPNGHRKVVNKDSVNGHASAVFNNSERSSAQIGDTVPLISYDDTDSASVVSSSTGTNDDETSVSEIPTVPIGRKNSKIMHQISNVEPFIDTSRMASFRGQDSEIGEPIRQYIFRLALEKNNTFAMAIENFIQCTKESTEANPSIIMRNIRQFMTGMKNYLLKHGEGQFEEMVQEERGKLKVDEFLNIDAIVEGTLHKLVIKPLKNYIYQLFVDAYKRNGSLQLLSDNIKVAREKSKEEMGIKAEFQPPEGPALEIVRHFLLRLQQEYSPVKKLENLLAAISTIYNCVQQRKTSQGKFHTSLGADDFLPIFIFVLVHCGMISAEIEADFMWGLLQPSMLSGEGGYYLTTLSSAVHVLKNFSSTLPLSEDSSRVRENVPNEIEGESKSSETSSLEPRLPSIADLQGFMKIMIPDELSGSIISKTLPVRPNMTTKDVCKMIALKFKITNPQDYGLFKLVKGDENQLNDTESPQSVKADLLATGVECLFAYKRCDANFIWPVLHDESKK